MSRKGSVSFVSQAETKQFNNKTLFVLKRSQVKFFKCKERTGKDAIQEFNKKYTSNSNGNSIYVVRRDDQGSRFEWIILFIVIIYICVYNCK